MKPKNQITYVVTGVDRNGIRFKPIRTTNAIHASGINLFRGSLWEETNDGKRKLLKRVWNY